MVYGVGGDQVEIVDRLIDLCIILIAAKVGGEVFARLRQPPVIGELIAGVIVGGSVLGWVEPGTDTIIGSLAVVGVILLLFQVGLEIHIREMIRLGPTAIAVAVIGVVTPFILGFVATLALDIGSGSTEVALFVGAAMTATSVGITARVFGDLGRLDGDEARTVIGAAVIDDVIGLIILAIVIGQLGGNGEFSTGDLLEITGKVAVFLIVSIALGLIAMPYLLQGLDRMRVPGSFITGAIVIAILLGVAAEKLAGLDPIVGAFVAGLIVGQAHHIEHIQEELEPIAHLLVPVFFVTIGAEVDVDVLFRPEVLGAGLLISLLAAAGKAISGLGVGTQPIDRWIVGVGMIPRGEVGLIFASLGVNQLRRVVGSEEVAIVVLMVIVTTLVAPLILNRMLRRDAAPAGGVEVE